MSDDFTSFFFSHGRPPSAADFYSVLRLIASSLFPRSGASPQAHPGLFFTFPFQHVKQCIELEQMA